MITKVKTILNIKDSKKDQLLSFYIHRTHQKILNYCRIDTIPQELESVWLSMIMDLYKAQESLQVASIKRGDTQITYATNKQLDDIVTGYSADLNRFRRLETLQGGK